VRVVFPKLVADIMNISDPLDDHILDLPTSGMPPSTKEDP